MDELNSTTFNLFQMTSDDEKEYLLEKKITDIDIFDGIKIKRTEDMSYIKTNSRNEIFNNHITGILDESEYLNMVDLNNSNIGNPFVLPIGDFSKLLSATLLAEKKKRDKIIYDQNLAEKRKNNQIRDAAKKMEEASNLLMKLSKIADEKNERDKMHIEYFGKMSVLDLNKHKKEQKKIKTEMQRTIDVRVRAESRDARNNLYGMIESDGISKYFSAEANAGELPSNNLEVQQI